MASHFLKIEMCNDVKYLPAVLNLVKEFGKIRGVNNKKLMNIELATEEAIVKAVGYAESLCENPIVITCREIPRGVEISVMDKGKPDIIDFRAIENKNLPEEEMVKNLDAVIMKGISDKVEYKNLGMDGREIVMEFYIDDVPIMESYKEKKVKSVNEQKSPAKKWKEEDVQVLPMEEKDAIEVSRCVFEVYGYTYPKEDFYYPERLCRLQKDGTLFCVIAKMPDGNVAGAGVINRATPIPGLFEYQSLVVKGEYRGLGVARKISNFILEYEKHNNPNLEGFFMEAVTNHPYSQKIAMKHQFYPTGFFFGLIPDFVHFKGFEHKKTSKNQRRISTLFNVLRVKPWDKLTLYIPEKHRTIIEKIYSQFNAKPELITDIITPENNKSSIVDTIFIEKMKLGIIKIETIARDFEHLIKQRILQLKSENVEVIFVYLNMNSKYAPWAAQFLEEHGFLFTGVLTGNEKFHPMLLQWFGGITFDINKIEVTYNMAKNLLEHIKKHDKSLNIV